MARGRMISKAISLDEKVNALPDDTARLLFTWIIPHLDREGRVHGDATTIKSIVFPRRNISVAKVEKYLKNMEDLKLILRFFVNGNQYLFASNFEKHQIGLQKEREAQSQIPAPPQDLLQSNTRVRSDKVIPKIKSKLKIKSKYIHIPDFIDKELWDDFLEMRRKMRKTPTDKAVSLLIGDLEKYKSAGDDPNEILRQSIKNNWAGVFPLKGGQGGAHRQNPRQLRPRDSYTNPDAG